MSANAPTRTSAASKRSQPPPTPKIVGISLLLLAVVAALFAYFVWPTPWLYYDDGGNHFRINRFNGGSQILIRSGWSNQ